jgi:hypothetical protein
VSTSLKSSRPPVFGRRPSLFHAVILAEGRAPIRCLAQEIDEHGASLEFGQTGILPKRFRLQWAELGIGADCEVLSTEGSCVRVAFTSEEGVAVARRYGGQHTFRLR